MYSTHLKLPGIALVVLYAASVLTLVIPKTVRAQNHVETAETSQEVSSVCSGQYSFVLQPLEAAPAIADQYMPVTYAAHRQRPEEIVRVELQVPAALLRTLWAEEESSRTIELHMPAALLGTWFTEDWVQMSHQSAALCWPFCSLY